MKKTLFNEIYYTIMKVSIFVLHIIITYRILKWTAPNVYGYSI